MKRRGASFRALLPAERGRIEDRPFRADPSIIPTVRRTHFCHATEADADAACHGRLQRDKAGCAPAFREHSQCLHHRFRTTANQALWLLVLLEKLRDETVKAAGTVVGGQVNFSAGLLELRHARQQVSAAYSIIQRHAPHGASRDLAAKTALAE